MATVWVRSSSSQDAVLRFPLRNNRLVLSSIAAHWQIDPTTILVGDLALSADADGASIFSMEEIGAHSSVAGLGDGLTQQTALVITGKPVTAGAGATRKEPEKPLAERVAAAAVPDEVFERLSREDTYRLSGLRRLLFKEQYNLMEEELYRSETGPHHYRCLIRAHSLGQAVAPFVGSLYIVPRNRRHTRLTFKDSKGMVTLVRPEGVLLTALDLLEGFEETKQKIIVKLPRLTGEDAFECRIRVVDSLVVHLETLEEQSFSGCLAIRHGSGGNFMFDGLRTMQLINSFQVHSGGDPTEVMLLPFGEVDPKSSLGGPVLNHVGEVKGIVVDASAFLREAGSCFGETVCTRYGEELQIQNLSPLERHKKLAEEWAIAWEKMGSKDSEAGKACSEDVRNWTEAFRLRRLVECMPARVEPVTQTWANENPLTDFVDKVVADLSKPKVHVATKAPVIKCHPLTEEQVRDFEAQQKAAPRISWSIP